jgi:hypothetical protein
MRYMIIMEASQQHYDAMSGKTTAVPTWAPEELEAMYAFMNDLNKDLVARGEWVDGQGLTAPAHARRVTRVDGETVVTDGPYAETKEVLAGYWIVDVDSIDRATEIAAHVTTCPGPGGSVDGLPVDIRPIDQPSSDAASEA